MTAIEMHFDDVVVTAQLNDSTTARAFAEQLPCEIKLCGCDIDFCGSIPFALPYQEKQVGRGWRNGDVNYNPGGGWFAVLYADEENSMRYGDQVNLGHIEGDLSVLKELQGSYNVRIEAKQDVSNEEYEQL